MGVHGPLAPLPFRGAGVSDHPAEVPELVDEGTRGTAPRKLADLVNRVLDKGVVLGGDVTISVAGIDLVFLRLSALLTSVATAREKLRSNGRVPPHATTATTLLSPPTPPTVTPSTGVDSARAMDAAPVADGASEPSGEGTTGQRSADPAPVAEALTTDIARVAEGFPQHVDIDPDAVQRDLARLVLMIVELLRRVVEHQAVRRLDDPDLSDEQIERVGIALERLEEKMHELLKVFGLAEHELDIDLGDLGTLL